MVKDGQKWCCKNTLWEFHYNLTHIKEIINRTEWHLNYCEKHTPFIQEGRGECKHVKKTLDISPYTCMHLCAHTHTPLLKMGNTVSEMKNSLGW